MGIALLKPINLLHIGVVNAKRSQDHLKINKIKIINIANHTWNIIGNRILKYKLINYFNLIILENYK